MSEVEDFLTQAEESQIVDAICIAEQHTSGEIRVHLERSSDKNAIERAKEVFYFLKMDETKNQNGVLFYVAVDDHQFSVIGDKGIDSVVSKDFWNSVKDAVISQFSDGNYAQGLRDGILETGIKLKKYFPYQPDDQDELPNEISR